MCGFAGEFLTDARAEVNIELLKTRAHRLRHRGPDAHGDWSDQRVGLSHVRLKLIDLENGRQPMQSPRGTVLSYNGEIYNNAELRAELGAHGCEFRSRSDTEVLLAAYETWGESAWERLNGMFAFALYNPKENRLFLVRDAQGIKPLHYRTTDHGLEFASEPTAWEDVASGKAVLDRHAVIHFLRFAQPAAGGRSLFQDIQVIEPGTYLTADSAGIRVRRWWSPNSGFESVVNDSETVVRGKLRHLLHLAMGRQMIADVPVGVFLSGGVDSAILVAHLAQMKPEPPITFTIALECDEEELWAARAVAKRWKCHHRELVISPAEFFAGMRELIRRRNSPAIYPNEVLIYLLSKLAVQEVKAVLTGEGADELFGGYTHILTLLELYDRAKVAESAGDPLLVKSMAAEFPHLDLSDDARFFAGAYSWFSAGELENLLTSSWRPELRANESDAVWDKLLYGTEHLSRMQRYHLLLEYAHLPNLLSRLDGATMAASLEGRVPYTDRDLVRYVSSLPSELKFTRVGQDKPLLRRFFADMLPPEVANRPKRPFDASLKRLFSLAEGQAELARINTGDAMFRIFDRNLLNEWMDRNTHAGHGLKTWLLLSLSMFLNRNLL